MAGRFAAACSGLGPVRRGSAPILGSKLADGTADPRGGGEHPLVAWSKSANFVASPRRRGARRCRPRAASALRLIPAQRGARRRQGQPHRGPGLIPAQAGRTARLGTPGRRRGSCPRRWGARSGVWSVIGGLRLIPSQAGSTRGTRTTTPTRPAHPRAGGEHSDGPCGVTHAATCRGSSPRRRGSRCTATGPALPDRLSRGSVPSCARPRCAGTPARGSLAPGRRSTGPVG